MMYGPYPAVFVASHSVAHGSSAVAYLLASTESINPYQK